MHCFLSVCDCNLFRVWYSSIYLIYTLFIIIFLVYLFMCVVVAVMGLFVFLVLFCFPQLCVCFFVAVAIFRLLVER